MRRRKIKFPLILKDDIKVRTLEDLQANFDLEKILAYYENGKLAVWLKDRYEDELAEEVAELDRTADDTVERLCEILGVSSENVGEVSLEIISKRNKRLKEVMLITDDREIINNSHKVVFNQQELDQLLESEPDTVYLYGNLFSITPAAKNVRYVGINNPEISFGEHKKKEYAEAGISFANLTLPNQYTSPFSGASKGDFVTFGKYENKELVWQVLDIIDGCCLAFCKNSVEDKKMDDSDKMHKYFFSTSLCEWLNNSFYNASFSEDEKDVICGIKEIPEKETDILRFLESDYNDTDNEYKVMLLSKRSFTKYSSAIKREVNIYSLYNHMWLRTKDRNVRSFFYVVNTTGIPKSWSKDTRSAVNPVLWIKTE